MQPESDQRTDEKLIAQAGRGDRQAFGILYERYLEAIYRYMFYRVALQEDAEDLTEQVFLKIWEKIPRLKSKERVRNFRAWLYRISHNLVVDYYREKAKDTSVALEERLVANEANLDQVIVDQEDDERLAQAIRQLEPIYQEILTARFINQLSHVETAAIVGKSHGHVRVLQYRALRKLKIILSEDKDV